MEIITGVERRRRWRLEEKLRIVAEAERPGACFAEVARRHEVGRSVLWTWRKQAREGLLAAEPPPVFLPVQVAPEPSPVAVTAPAEPVTVSAPARTTPDKAAARIEIALPDGTVVRVDEAVGSAALRRVMAAVRA